MLLPGRLVSGVLWYNGGRHRSIIFLPSILEQSASGNFKRGLASGCDGSDDSWGTKTRDFEQIFKRPRTNSFSVVFFLVPLLICEVLDLTEPSKTK